MNRTIKSRIEQLESRQYRSRPRMISYGWLSAKPLDDYDGPTHYVITKREPTASPYAEWCEFEERPGPAPK